MLMVQKRNAECTITVYPPFLCFTFQQIFLSHDVFRDAIPICERNHEVVKHVFTNPQQVMAKFVLNFYTFKLQTFIRAKLEDKADTGKYLKVLHELYLNTSKLSETLSLFDMGSDETFLPKLTMRIFQRELDDYIR